MIQLREASARDFQQICDLIKNEAELFKCYPAGSFPLNVAQLHDLSKHRKNLTVAVDDAQVIGFANFYNYVMAKSAFVGNIVIKNAFRGQGLGRKIVAYMLELAFNRHGLQEVHLSVFSHNTKAILLYSNIGFRPYRIEERSDHANKRAALLHMKLERENYKSSHRSDANSLRTAV